MDKKSWQQLFARTQETNKYDYGHVLILGGSEAMIGAPVLAGRAALRSGAGLVTIASTSEAISLIDRDIEEIMTLSLPPWNNIEESIDTIEKFIESRHVSVLVIGPGLSTDADKTIRALLSRVELPMVLDAEVFTALSDHLPALQLAAKANKNIVLTPHPGEYARLINSEPQYSEKDEQAALRKFAHAYNITIVLKHHHSLVVSAQGETYKNITGGPGLATAGSGDVLSGVIAGLLAQGIDVYEAAQMAVYLHGLAGDKAVELNTEPGMIASDIIDFLPEALKEQEHRWDLASIPETVATFFRSFPKHTFTKGEILIQATENPKSVFYIIEGRVSQYDITTTGNEMVVNIFKPGAFFPMSSAINNPPNRYFFEASTPLDVHIAPAADVIQFLKENPDVLFDLLARVYRGTDGVLRRMAHLMGGSAKTRLLFELLNASYRFGEQQTDGTLRIALTESDLAKHSGLARETVNRIIKDLKIDGLVAVGGKGISVADTSALERALGSEV